jgi:hypothetical protein
MTKQLDAIGVQPDAFEPSTQACEAVERLLDEVTVRETWHTDETFVQCLLCGEWDSHTDDCAVPALLRWQKGGE